MTDWKTVADIAEIRKQYPEWTDEQCRAEFNRLMIEAIAQKLEKK